MFFFSRNITYISLFSILTIGCAQIHVTKETLVGAAWKTNGIVTNENREQIFPELEFPELKEKDNLGICFSGGGNRSAVATLGQLRGLHESGLLKRVRYVSAVSGGAWGASPWVYLNNSVTSDEEFLGSYVAPKNLTLNDFKTIPDGSFASTLSDKTIGLRKTLLRNHGDENFAFAIRQVYLEEWNLDDKDKFTAFRIKDALKIIEKNSKHTQLKLEDFHICKPGRPYLIINAAIAMRHRWAYKEYFRPIEFTPNYTGSRNYQQGRKGIYKILETSTGGGFVENTVYDGKPTHVKQTGPNRYRVTANNKKEYPYSWRLDPRLSLSDMLAATGSAPTVVIPYLSELIGFPQFYHTSPANFPEIDTEELSHTDGGAIDNLGIVPLLARGVTKIIAFANTSDEYKKLGKYSNCRPTALAQYFGVGTGASLKGSPRYDSVAVRNQQHALMNHVFSNKNCELEKMQKAFDKQSETGKVLYYNATLTTVENKYHGIKGGQKVKVCFFLLGPKFNAEADQPELGVSPETNALNTRWASQIKDLEVKKMFTQKELRNFPHYKTFSQNGFSFMELFTGVKLINLTKIQVNALTHYTSYQVVAYKREIKEFLDIR